MTAHSTRYYALTASLPMYHVERPKRQRCNVMTALGTKHNIKTAKAERYISRQPEGTRWNAMTARCTRYYVPAGKFPEVPCPDDLAPDGTT